MCSYCSESAELYNYLRIFKDKQAIEISVDRLIKITGKE